MKKRLWIIFTMLIVIIVVAILIKTVNKNEADTITIMLDPGHGGVKDNLKGAIIATGGREVTLNNSLTLKITRYLEDAGYEVIFTRDPNTEEEYVSLDERSQIANEKKPDLLISIHHDSIADPSVTGFSIYYSSYRSNIDKEDVYLLYQNKEYKFIREQIIGGRTHVYYEDSGETKELVSGDDRYKIRDRTPHEVATKSIEFADYLFEELKSLDYVKPLHGRKEKAIIDNDLRITRSTNVPSILFEAGFVSNKEEAEKISKDENQEKFARQLVKAVEKYFEFQK